MNLLHNTNCTPNNQMMLFSIEPPTQVVRLRYGLAPPPESKGYRREDIWMEEKNIKQTLGHKFVEVSLNNYQSAL